MRFSVVQTDKKSFNASFDVTGPDGKVGWVMYESPLVDDCGKWSGAFGSSSFALGYEGSASIATIVTGLVDDERVYELAVDGAAAGKVWREARVSGSVDGGVKLVAVRADVCGRELEMYPFSMGRKGFRYPLFEGQRQIAEIAKGCKVKNDLHEFEIAVANEADAFPALVMCCYVFSQSWWRPGPARRHDTQLYIQRATRPGIGYYDAGFFERVR